MKIYSKILIFLLFSHGVLYFFVGGLYDDSNPVKYIKYILVSLFIINLALAVLLDKSLVMSKSLLIISLTLFALFLVSSCYQLMIGESIFKVFLFFFPLVSYFCYRNFTLKEFVQILKYVVFLGCVVSIIEWSFLSEISSRFNQSGFRSVSIFVNPNALGLFMCLALSLILFFEVTNIIHKAYWLLIGGVPIFLSGSATGYACFIFISLICTYQVVTKLNMFKLSQFGWICLFTAIFLVVILGNFYVNIANVDFQIGSREFSLNSFFSRLDYLRVFYSELDQCFFFPMVCNKSLYADNALVFSWIILGAIPALVLLLLSLYPIVISGLNKSPYYYFSFFCVVALGSLTANVLNIWPISYMFWIVYGYFNQYLKERLQ